MKRLLIYFLPLLFVSSCDGVPSQDFFTEKTVADSSAVSDSLLFLEYSERYNYHYGMRSDSVSWYLDELLKLSERNNKQLEVLRLLTNKATGLMNSGEYSAALEYYTRAFEMVQNPEIENSYWTLGTDPTPEKRRLRILSFLHFNYGHLMDLTENSEERLNQYRIANQIAVENDDAIIESYTSTALAIAYLEKNEIDSAQIYNRRSIRLSEQLPTQFYTSFTFWVQGNIYMTLEEYDDAYRSYTAGKKSAQNENNYQGLLINYLGLSRYFYQVNEPDSSLYYGYRTVGDGSVSDFQALRFDLGVAYENLYQVYKLRNEPLNALNYLELAKSTRDSLNTLRIKNLALFQQNLLNQQLEQKERERRFESIQARNRIIAVLVLLVVMVIIAIVLYRNYKIKKVANQRLDETNALLTDSLEKLTSAQDQLVQQEKLASLGQLTAGIAHEIKNPLNFVNNFSDVSLELVEEVREELRRMTEDQGRDTSPLLRGDVIADGDDRDVSVGAQGDNQNQNTEINPDSANTPLTPLSRGKAGSSAQMDFFTDILEILDDIETNLKTIHKHGSRADGIVKSMLQHSRGGDGVMEPTPLNPLIREYVNLCFHGMRAGNDPINVDIDLQLDESVGEVPLVAEDFSRVILNLTNNAFDAMRSKLTEDGGPGTGEKSPLEGSGEAERSRGVSFVEDYQPKLTVRSHQNGTTVIIEIEDNGPGIPEEMKDKILQPFFTTKKGTQGTGLGLSITNDIIKAHGGSLDIESTEGKTIFSITL